MDILTVVHAWIRWAIVLAGLLGALRPLAAGRGPWRPASPDRILGKAYTALLDLNWLVGLVLFVWIFRDPDPAGRWVHLAVMTAAVAVAHVFGVKARRAPEESAAGLTVLGYGLSLALIGVGHVFVI